MAVYRETYTKPLPPGAEVFSRKGERFARWTDRKGRKHVAKVTTPAEGKHAGTDRLLIEAGTYTAKYRNGTGQVVKVSTGCRSLDAARAVLVELETRADKVRSGKWSVAEDAVLDHRSTPVTSHVEAYIDHLGQRRGKGGRPRIAPRHVAVVETCLERITEACAFKLLRDLNRAAVERWADQKEAEGMAARTLNAHLSALTAFGNWCVETKRLVGNPFARPPKRDEKADSRRARRALTEDELRRLLSAAQLRPLAEYGRPTVRLAKGAERADKRSRRTWTKAPLTADTLATAADRARGVLAKRRDFVAKLERIGRERALIYKTLTLTGLRVGELRSLTVGQLDLDEAVAYAVLRAADEKAGRGAEIPLRADLAKDLRNGSPSGSALLRRPRSENHGLSRCGCRRTRRCSVSRRT